MNKFIANIRASFWRQFWCAFLFAFILSALVTTSFAANGRFIPLKHNEVQMKKNHHYISLRSASNQTKSIALPSEAKRSFSLKDYKPRIMRTALRLPFAKKVIKQDSETKQYSSLVTSPNEKSDFSHQWPVDPSVEQYISSPFGYRSDPFTGEKAFHAGIDIAAAKGTKVLASAGGVVTGVGTHARLGKYVRIDHEGNEYSLYGHLSKINVSNGQTISASDVIGEVGSTGRSTGPHLDYSLRKKGQPVDPRKYLSPLMHQQTASLQLNRLK